MEPDEIARRWLTLWQDHWTQSLAAPETALALTRFLESVTRDATQGVGAVGAAGTAALALASPGGGGRLVECEHRIAELERRLAELESGGARSVAGGGGGDAAPGTRRGDGARGGG